jgi:hypothetical protein
MNDASAIRQVVENWVVWRDAGDWERFATVWHPDGWMTATWFQGPASRFIEVSREGFERGVNFSFREAPIFQGLFTGMLALGALVALIPGLPLIQLIIIAQVINGILLPILLVFILRLINDRRIMGQYTNTLGKNIIAWATVVTLIGLTALMLTSVILPFFGVPFLQ